MRPAGRWGATAWSCSIAITVAAWSIVRWPAPMWMLADIDCAHQLGGASQILRGEHPFVDWHTDYGALRYYPSAAAQVLFGRRTLAELLLDTTGYTVAYTLLFHLLRTASGRRAAAAGAVLAIALLLMPWMSRYYTVLGPVLCLAAAWRYIGRPSRASLALLAAAVVVMGLFRADFGGFTAVAAVVAIGTGGGSGRARAVEIGRFLAIAMLFLSPWLIWLAHRGAVERYLTDTFFTAPVHAASMALPFPRHDPSVPFHDRGNATFLLFVTFHALPAVALVTTLCKGVCVDVVERRRIATTAVLAQMVLLHTAHRSDYPHLAQAIPTGLVLLAWLLGRALDVHPIPFGAVGRPGLAAIGLLLAVPAWAGLQVEGWPRVDIRKAFETAQLHAMPLDQMVARLSAAHPGDASLGAIEYVRRCTAPTDRVVALPPMLGLYYFADRPFAGNLPAWSPGFFSATADQAAWIARVRGQRPRMVVGDLGSGFDGRPERSFAVYSKLISEYVSTQFVPIAVFGSIVVRAPIGTAHPVAGGADGRPACPEG